MHGTPAHMAERVSLKFEGKTEKRPLSKLQCCAMCQPLPLPGAGGWERVCLGGSLEEQPQNGAGEAENQIANVWAVLLGTSVFMTASVSQAMASAGHEPSALQMTERMQKVVSQEEYKVQKANESAKATSVSVLSWKQNIILFS